jgi:hypothetical protein
MSHGEGRDAGQKLNQPAGLGPPIAHQIRHAIPVLTLTAYAPAPPLHDGGTHGTAKALSRYDIKYSVIFVTVYRRDFLLSPYRLAAA